ncbi:SpoIIE family protein phosphatase [Modestobacter sp. I12A-02628]|uniref:SpoIIE family protein phosphatase n=1 Tax=Goekera deserti TaxID=2497753 RepID=A0A7K3WHB8_9ACTN|nr:SpoIIE family protein phosphatase [Goekera deserti]MPQ98061.1 SpoIIE family protein phosphatase [Goekera deserti]NDI48708.1 SpoIIE family protein phosphatase [Goekera deserti]NEL54913.1 SpoIIE family protein phosphatase [Goekera deserti]
MTTSTGDRPPPPDLTEAQLGLALEAAQLGLWDWDVVTGRLVWSERSLEMFGVPLEQRTGSVTDIEAPIHPDDLPAVQGALEQAVATAGVVDVEFRTVWPDGSVHWVHARGRALVDGAGHVWRVIGTNDDVTALRAAEQERARDAARMAGLVGVAQALGDAQDELEVLQVVAERGVRLMGADGAVLGLLADDGRRVRALTSGQLAEDVRAEVAEMPVGVPVPLVVTAVTGEAVFFGDRAALAERYPGAVELYERARTQASATVPLLARGRVVGALGVAFRGPRTWRPADRELLETFAALTAQAVERIRAREAERAATRAGQRLSEMLQRSLLTDPPEPNDLRIAVRYQPATREAQVGGDWYDAFLSSGGTTLVIGDVAGHDRTATAGMAQVRNVLRGVAQTVGEPPGAVLGALDRALQQLRVPTLTTAVICQLDGPGPGGGRLLRWSNAGHPPPLVLHPDGTTELLWRRPDLLLGVDPAAGRADHELVLEPGATLVLYTDGLVERRGESLDDAFERLRLAAAGLHDLPTEQVCDVLLGRLGSDAEDDVALLVLRP